MLVLFKLLLNSSSYPLPIHINPRNVEQEFSQGRLISLSSSAYMHGSFLKIKKDVLSDGPCWCITWLEEIYECLYKKKKCSLCLGYQWPSLLEELPAQVKTVQDLWLSISSSQPICRERSKGFSFLLIMQYTTPLISIPLSASFCPPYSASEVAKVFLSTPYQDKNYLVLIFVIAKPCQWFYQVYCSSPYLLLHFF